MKTLIHCKRCGRYNRWSDMARGGQQKTYEGILELRHCPCGSTYSQFVDASSSSRLKTRLLSRTNPPRTLTARQIIKSAGLYNMSIPWKRRVG